MLKKIKQKTYKFLRLSEKYTKTDMVYLAKGGFWLTTGQIFSSASAFLLAIAYANFLPQEIYGTYKYILSVAGILGALTLTGMGTAVIRSVAKGFEGTLKFAFWKNLKWSILMFLASLFGALYYFINENNTLAISLLIVGSFSPLLQSANMYTSFLNGKKEFRATTIYGIFRSLIPALSIFTTIILTNNPIIIVFIYFFSQTATALFFYFKSIKKFQENNKIDKTSLNYSKHLSLMNILNTIAAHIDKILIFQFLGAAQLAIYTFAIAIPTQLLFIKKALRAMVLPKLSNNNISEMQKHLPRKALQLFIFLIPILIIYIITSTYIYEYLFPQYKDSIVYSQVFSLFILAFPSLFFNQALVAHYKKKELYTINTISPLIQIILFIILIPMYGIWGVISSILITRYISLLILFILFKKIR